MWKGRIGNWISQMGMKKKVLRSIINAFLMKELLAYLYLNKEGLLIDFRAIVVLKNIAVMLDERANVKWDPDEEDPNPELNVWLNKYLS